LRLGYSIDRFLPYVTGGVSIGQFTADILGQPLGVNSNLTFNWTAGAGVEFVISGPVTGKLEYLFVNHTNVTCVVECNGPVNVAVSENLFRVGLNYRLWQR
jgi:outer membrane immunogenic protein